MSNPFELLNERLTNIEALLAELKNQSKEHVPEGDVWMNLQELQNYLPDKPAKPTVYEWVGKKIIPYHRRGKKLYFLKAEIDLWLREGKRKTAQDIKDEAKKYLKNKTSHQ